MNQTQGRPPGSRPDDGLDVYLLQLPRLFGRDAQQHELLSVVVGFDELAAPGALLLGAPGTGKSTMLQAVQGSVQGVVLARARLGDRLVPYAALTRWLRAIVAHAPQALDDESKAALAALLPELAPRVPEAAVGAGPPSPAAVARLLHRAAADVVAWMVDDAQFADDASARWWLQMFRQLSKNAPPFIVASEPPEPGSPVEAMLEAAAGLAGVRALQIGPLERSQLFDWLMDEGTPGVTAKRADELAARLMQATGGVPLHLRLLLHDPDTRAGSLVEAAALPDHEPVPELTRLLGQRLARLGPAALSFARAASVAGQDCTDAAVMDFTGLTREELESAQQELRAQELWSDDDFAHPRVREAARQATPDAMARALHAHFAAWLEGHEGAAERIAAHWQAADQPVRALPALARAAQRARRLHCMAESMACLMRAAAIAEEHGQLDLAFDCCCEAFETHADALRRTDGSLLLEQLTRLARSPQQQARAATQRAWHAMVHGRLETAIESAEQAVGLARSEGDEQVRMPAQQMLGTALGVAGQLQRALQLMLAAEPWVQQHAPADARASFLGNLAAVQDNLGHADEARRQHLAALSLASQACGAEQRAMLLANYALSRLEAGDPIGARELAAKAQALIESGAADDGAAAFLALIWAACERTLGRYATALEWCDRAEALLSDRTPDRMPLAQMSRAHVWLDLGVHDRALQILGGAGLPLGRQLPARHAVRWLLLLARAQMRSGTDAGTTLQEAQERLPAEGWPELALLLRAERALARPGVDAAPELREIAISAAEAGLANVALGAWLLCAWQACSQVDQRLLASAAAEAALALMVKGTEATHVDRALRWLAPARALGACGEHERARGLLLRGRHWLVSTAAAHVPQPVRETFLQQPLHRLLHQTDAAAS